MEATCIHCREAIEGYSSSFNDTAAGPVHFVCALTAAQRPASGRPEQRALAAQLQELGEGARPAIEAWAAGQGLTLLPLPDDLVWDPSTSQWRASVQGPAGEALSITSTSDLRRLFGRRPGPAQMEG